MKTKEKLVSALKEYKEELEYELKKTDQMLNDVSTEKLEDKQIPKVFRKETQGSIVDPRTLSDEDLKTLCGEYPYSARIKEKFLYLEGIFKMPWRIKDMREIIVRIEGAEKNNDLKLWTQASSACQNLRTNGSHRALKMGTQNNQTFYGRKEWAEESTIAFRPEYPILERILQEIPEHARQPIAWV